jgi:hypothetical protein
MSLDLELVMSEEQEAELARRSGILRVELTRLVPALEELQSSLGVRARALVQQGDPAAACWITRLAPLGLIGTTKTVLKNLATPRTASTSFAILGSGALRDTLNQLIHYLEGGPHTSDLDLTVLKQVSQAIHFYFDPICSVPMDP